LKTIFKQPEPHLLGQTQHIHFVGIGGAGLSGIAEILAHHGFQITGSDQRQNESTQRLIDLGLIIFQGHLAEQVGTADVVVTSPAVPTDNPEVQLAIARKIPVIRGAEMLAEIMRSYYSIAISGTHGKTTTTAMTAAVLERLDPTVVVGGKLISIGSHARIGQSDLMVVEADEAYGSFKHYTPGLAVVTSIDVDHLDYYHDLAEIRSAFLNFINKVPFYGSAVLCLDQENIRQILPQVRKRYVTYGVETEAEIKADQIQFENTRSSFRVSQSGNPLGQIQLNMPGLHNVSNALAAIAVGLTISSAFGRDYPTPLSFQQIQEALANFQGIHRRFEILGEVKGIMVVDDYAHNPAKLRAVFRAAKTGYNRRVVGIVQPHRYQRVQSLADEFAVSFADTDLLLLTPIYAAEETPLNGVSAKILADSIRDQGHPNVIYMSDLVVEEIVDLLQPNDIVITAGAGDIWQVGRKLLKYLKDAN